MKVLISILIICEIIEFVIGIVYLIFSKIKEDRR